MYSFSPLPRLFPGWVTRLLEWLRTRSDLPLWIGYRSILLHPAVRRAPLPDALQRAAGGRPLRRGMAGQLEFESRRNGVPGIEDEVVAGTCLSERQRQFVGLAACHPCEEAPVVPAIAAPHALSP